MARVQVELSADRTVALEHYKDGFIATFHNRSVSTRVRLSREAVEAFVGLAPHILSIDSASQESWAVEEQTEQA